jgi:hypothetical protein
MYVRLGFAVAVNLDPDVLLVDEVHAVGDELFQAKCLSRIKQFQRDGRTIVFVTHDAGTVRQVCDRAIVVDHGRVVLDGLPNDAISTFREHLHGNLSDRLVDNDAGTGVITAVTARRSDPAGHVGEGSLLAPGDGLALAVEVAPTTPIRQPILGIEVTDRQGGLIYAADTDDLAIDLEPIDRPVRLQVSLGRLWLLDPRPDRMRRNLREPADERGALRCVRHSVPDRCNLHCWRVRMSCRSDRMQRRVRGCVRRRPLRCVRREVRQGSHHVRGARGREQ